VARPDRSCPGCSYGAAKRAFRQAAIRTPPFLQALRQRGGAGDIVFVGQRVAGRIDPLTDRDAVADPPLRIAARPRPQPLGGDLRGKPGGHFRAGELLAVDHRAVPHGVQIALHAEVANADGVAAAVGGVADVQRLVQIADDVDRETQRELAVGGRGGLVLQRCREPRERGHRIAFGRRADVGVGLALGHRHAMPGAGGLAPELLGTRGHDIRPGRGFGQALVTEDAANGRLSVAAQIALGEGAGDAVPGLAPGPGVGGPGDQQRDRQRVHDSNGHGLAPAVGCVSRTVAILPDG